jgi:hypothetical protein
VPSGFNPFLNDLGEIGTPPRARPVRHPIAVMQTVIAIIQSGNR